MLERGNPAKHHKKKAPKKGKMLEFGDGQEYNLVILSGDL